MKTRKKTPIEDRFWAKVQKTDTCWLWTGATTYGGYGVLQSGGRPSKIIRAHRLSWILHNGPLPDDLDICHSCDNPRCVNPAHLTPGTAKDNMQDCKAKGRNYITDERRPRGEQHHQAKLTNAQVAAIRAAYATGNTSLNRLAGEYGVSKRAILNVVHNRVWRHVTPQEPSG